MPPKQDIFQEDLISFGSKEDTDRGEKDDTYYHSVFDKIINQVKESAVPAGVSTLSPNQCDICGAKGATKFKEFADVNRK